MEKLFLSLLLVCNIQISIAQKFTIFDTKGTPTYILNTTEAPLLKGQQLKEETLHLRTGDTLRILDNDGSMYVLSNPKKYSVAQIKNYPSTAQEASLSKKYFKYVWQKLNETETVKNHTGNVYRSDKIDLLIKPVDSVAIYANEINFSWKKDSTNLYTYFFLKRLSDETLTKLKIRGNEITLFVDNTFLKEGEAYSWGIAHTKFPNFNLIKFNAISLLSKDDYLSAKVTYQPFINSLISQGYSQLEIDKFLCEYYNVCN